MRPKLRSVGPDRNVQISPEDAASVLGISRRQVYRQLADGVIPCRRVGRRYVIFRADVEQMSAGPKEVTTQTPFDLLLSGQFELVIRLRRVSD